MARLWILIATLLPSVCQAQVTGVFSIDKSIFAHGEPVFLNLTIRNEGKQPEEVSSADPYSFCSGYAIHITRNGAPKTACSRTFGISCMLGAITIGPGKTHTERILLNARSESIRDDNDPISAPGDYMVEASKDISSGAVGTVLPVAANAASNKVHQWFNVQIDGNREAPPSSYATFVKQLNSADQQARSEAARTLATLAPPALEALLLSFATSKDDALRQFAPLALANLGTKASLSALAQMLLQTSPGCYESMTSAEKLAETHDLVWFPILLSFADQYPMYLRYAAENGGDSAVAPIATRLRSGNSEIRTKAIYALGETGSRAAVPILISLLSSGSNRGDGDDDASAADNALKALTYLYDEPAADGSVRPEARSRWQRWWLASGTTATIYKAGECSQFEKLPY